MHFCELCQISYIVNVDYFPHCPPSELFCSRKLARKFICTIVTCRGLSDLGNGPNKPTAIIICEYSASLQDAALVFTLVRARISDSDKNLATFLTTHH